MVGTDALRLVRYGAAPTGPIAAPGLQQQLDQIQQQALTYMNTVSVTPAAYTPPVVAPVPMAPLPPPPLPVPPPPPPPLPPAPVLQPPALPYPAPTPAATQTDAQLVQLQAMIDNLQRQIQAFEAWRRGQQPAPWPQQPAPVQVQPPPYQPQPYQPAPAPYPPAGVQPAPAPAPAGTNQQPWQPGPGRLEGADTSHWQSDATFNQSINGSQWSAIKATQGTSYVDPTFKSRWAQLGQKIEKGEMTLRVAYLFLDPGNGAGQARHFLDTLDIHGPLPAGTRLALDWETAALRSPETLREAANYIHQVTGLWPLIYVQASKLAAAKAAVPEAPIWEAAWSSGVKTDVPFFQYSNGPGYDHDVFNGDVAALRRFAGFAA